MRNQFEIIVSNGAKMYSNTHLTYMFDVQVYNISKKKKTIKNRTNIHIMHQIYVSNFFFKCPLSKVSNSLSDNDLVSNALKLKSTATTQIKCTKVLLLNGNFVLVPSHGITKIVKTIAHSPQNQIDPIYIYIYLMH